MKTKGQQWKNGKIYLKFMCPILLLASPVIPHGSAEIVDESGRKFYLVHWHMGTQWANIWKSAVWNCAKLSNKRHFNLHTWVSCGVWTHFCCNDCEGLLDAGMEICTLDELEVMVRISLWFWWELIPSTADISVDNLL